MYLIKLLTIFILITELRAKRRPISRENNCYETSFLNENKHFDLCGSLRKAFFVHGALSKPKESTVCSPISALMPLGKVALGAEGQSLKELLEAIGVSKKSTLTDHFKRLILELRYLPCVMLDIASKLYISMNSRLQRTFTDQARDIFHSSAEKIDFQYPTYASEQINSWVSSQTNGFIKDIISPNDVPPSTSLILVNAVYFNGKWKETFENVKNGTFHSPSGQKTVTMISRTGNYNYSKSESLGAQLVKIPYKDDKVTFLLVLPKSRTGLPVLLSQLKLAPDILDSAISHMEETKIQLTMPKFKIDSDLNLKEVYEKIGVKQMFSKSDSGLTKIVRDETLYVTSAKHKAYIEVNEFGTEAAASSASMISKMAYQTPLNFKADHPFLFFILVRGQQLFSGTLVNPT